LSERTEPKVIRRARMRHDDGMSYSMVYTGGADYKITVLKEIGGFSRVLVEALIQANSHRHAMRKLRNWLDSRYPIKQEAKQKLEELFA
jgi:hypothetical protein